MNEVSIIINGTKYDAVQSECLNSCASCDLSDICEKEHNICEALNIHIFDCFKKSTKSFER